ncbi:26913_t:CDS:2 [Dentiscutata erythropus]|uniref:26913_t:CDS:1 n=1 Tax=Dentiscutata erythropus TaxID=1348616 RepID=A0A9N9CVY2_9GLOM|nr:26913_t:CDS:2 [Dentiscutata erythropus]
MSSSKTHSAQNANSQEPKPPSVLFCYGCEKEKPIHSFSKTQITKAMANIYNQCMKKQQDEDTDDSEDYDDSEDGSYNETWDDIL